MGGTGGRQPSQRVPRRRPIGARRPRLVAFLAAVVLVALGALGSGVEGKLKSTSLSVSGTESARGEEMLREHFGDSASFAVLLSGPAAAVDRQGPRLIAVLRRDPKVTTVSPWDRGAGLESLRPNPRTALILVDFHTAVDAAFKKTVPHLNRVLAASVSAPVAVRSAGFASVARAIADESQAVTRRGEAIVTPLLLIVLLLVFRSPIAALIPLLFGAITVIASRGVLAILASFIDISGLALSIASMIGLALGVDYALLIVSRFREELAAGRDPVEAASITRTTAGRTTVFAGAALFISILVALFLVPGMLLSSLCITVGVGVVFAVAGPWLVGPAVLVLVGRNVNRWQIGSRATTRTRWLSLSRGALRRPAATAIIAGLLLVLIALPALTIATGPLTIDQLPADNPERLDVEAIEAAVGGGWISPAIVVVARDRGPVTEPRRLRALDEWQARVARDPAVAAVIGPGPLARRVAPLQRAGRSFFDQRGPPTGPARMVADLDRAGRGLQRLRLGLGRASEGAHTLTTGSGRAEEGAGLLAHGLSLVNSGGGDSRRALTRFSRGAHRLASGQRSALLGASVLRFSADELSSEVGARALPEAARLAAQLRAAAVAPQTSAAATTTVERLQAAWRELGAMTVGADDPHYAALAAALREALSAASGADPVSGAPYASGYKGLPSELAALDALLDRLAHDADKLHTRLLGVEQSAKLLQSLARRLYRGIERLKDGSGRLAGGSDRIVGAATRLGGGLAQLDHGAVRLAAGLSRLRDGNAALAHGLSSAYQRMRPLVNGARSAEVRISASRQRLRRSSPGLFDSGYFVLSALDGAPARERDLAGQAIDLGAGGQAAKMLVVSDEGLNAPGVDALDQRLRRAAAALAVATGTEVAVTGGIAQTRDYDRATTARIPALVIVITLIIFLAMLAILRALPLALIAIAFNLLAVAAAFGVLRLLFYVPEGWPFGGTDHIDPVSAAGIFGIVFGLSIDYAVFLLMRMRESWVRDGDNETAIAYGLERTATVITGAATIMAVVFCVFATATIDSIAQFGVGLTVAVLIDATVIRLMLLPAVMKLIGPRVWWLPGWLDRRLPRIDAHGGQA